MTIVAMSKARKRAEKIWSCLNESEKYGVKFGLFPLGKCPRLSHEETVALMEIAGKEV